MGSPKEMLVLVTGNVAEGYVQGDIHAANCPGAPSPLRAVQQVSAQFAGDCEEVLGSLVQNAWGGGVNSS